MDSKQEYSKLSIEDTESNSSTLDAGPEEFLCQKCSSNIEGARGSLGRRIFARISIFQICVYILLITVNLGTIALWLRKAPTVTDSFCPPASVVTDCTRPVLIFSPAKADGAIVYEKSMLTIDVDSNVYTGAPRELHDKAWHRMVEPMTIKISNEEMALLDDKKSIKFADGSGYIAEPTVYHELHCIKRIRRHLHLDHYYPNLTDIERIREDVHMDHCLEYWRTQAMCRGDTSMVGYFWRGPEIVSHVTSVRECVNWEALDGWARSRMVDMSDFSIFEPLEPSE